MCGRMDEEMMELGGPETEEQPGYWSEEGVMVFAVDRQRLKRTEKGLRREKRGSAEIGIPKRRTGTRREVDVKRNGKACGGDRIQLLVSRRCGSYRERGKAPGQTKLCGVVRTLWEKGLATREKEKKA